MRMKESERIPGLYTWRPDDADMTTAPTLTEAIDVLTIYAPGEPQPKQRPRFNPRHGIVYSDRRSKEAEKALGQYAHVAIAASAWRFPLAEPVGVSIQFQSGNARNGPNRPDLDNLLKLALDGLNGVVWEDDRLVEVVEAQYFFDSPEPCTIIDIWLLDGANAEAVTA